ncbi:complexed with cef1p [Desmophyllum pertusum]|uniref:Complexed with cef1p n=1 Tax=Desmophyllum pertusum TaxID=174260 RepID=A0A9X0D9R9_9CNID|nr:complexed with cef1p [Desmophyllum pertusum]
MTTAARPTWDTAKGKGEGDLSALSKQYSSRDLPSHTKLKHRTAQQRLRKDLEDRERQAARDRTKEKGSRSTADPPKRPRLDQPPPSNLDADDPVDDDDDDDSDESDDEDDTAELLAELQRIKKERAQEEARKVRFVSSSPQR